MGKVHGSLARAGKVKVCCLFHEWNVELFQVGPSADERNSLKLPRYPFLSLHPVLNDILQHISDSETATDPREIISSQIRRFSDAAQATLMNGTLQVEPQEKKKTPKGRAKKRQAVTDIIVWGLYWRWGTESHTPADSWTWPWLVESGRYVLAGGTLVTDSRGCMMDEMIMGCYGVYWCVRAIDEPESYCVNDEGLRRGEGFREIWRRMKMWVKWMCIKEIGWNRGFPRSTCFSIKWSRQHLSFPYQSKTVHIP